MGLSGKVQTVLPYPYGTDAPVRWRLPSSWKGRGVLMAYLALDTKIE